LFLSLRPELTNAVNNNNGFFLSGHLQLLGCFGDDYQPHETGFRTLPCLNIACVVCGVRCASADADGVGGRTCPMIDA